MAEKLKVLILNGSPRTEGNTTIAIHEMEHVLKKTAWNMRRSKLGKWISEDVRHAEHVIKTESVCLMIS